MYDKQASKSVFHEKDGDRQRVDKTLNNLNLIEPHQGLPSFEGKIFPTGVIPLQKLLDKEYEIKSS